MLRSHFPVLTSGSVRMMFRDAVGRWWMVLFYGCFMCCCSVALCGFVLRGSWFPVVFNVLAMLFFDDVKFRMLQDVVMPGKKFRKSHLS